jgi:DNA-binding NtrC family response regulator
MHRSISTGASARIVRVGSQTSQAYEQARPYVAASGIVILVGPTGAGKTTLARWMHDEGPRCGSPFVAISAMELVESMAYDQLFGHVPGAYTGAVGRGHGVFERARSGTALFDEFHLLPTSVQALLLRALSTGVYLPLGGERDVPILCRVIICTRDCPDEMMERGDLLPDLRYRLGYCIVTVSGLADQRDVIAAFAQTFLESCREVTGVTGPCAFSPDVMPALEAAPWPGNLRELRGVVEAAYLHAVGDTMVRFDHLPPHVRIAPRFKPHGDPSENARVVEWALWRTGNRIDRAAALIGAHRNTISKYLADREARAGDERGPAHIPAEGNVRGDPSLS